MKVKTLIEKEGGIYEFTAELSDLQHQFLIEWALKDLIKRGLIPFNADGEAGNSDGNFSVEVGETLN